MSDLTHLNLTDLLADFYPDIASIRRIGDEAGIAMERVDLSGAAINVWNRVLDEAFNTGTNSGLLQATMAEYGMNTRLARAWEVELTQRRGRETRKHIGQVDVNMLLLHKMTELADQVALGRAENSAVRHEVKGHMNAVNLRLEGFAIERSQATKKLLLWLLAGVVFIAPLSTAFLPALLRAVADLLG